SATTWLVRSDKVGICDEIVLSKGTAPCPAAQLASRRGATCSAWHQRQAGFWSRGAGCRYGRAVQGVGSGLMSRIYTMSEAAKVLGKSRRWLQSWLSLHPADPNGNPYYAPFGRTKTFDDNDLARIRAAVREGERCRLSLLSPVRARRRTIRVVARTSGD